MSSTPTASKSTPVDSKYHHELHSAATHLLSDLLAGTEEAISLTAKAARNQLSDAFFELSENGPPDADDDIAESRPDVDLNALLSDIETPDDLTTLEGINAKDLSTTDKARVVEKVEQAKLKTF